MKVLQIHINISAEEYLKVYQGNAHDVVAKATNGQRVRFPAGILKPFVLHDGINGLFEITFNDQNKFISIDRA